MAKFPFPVKHNGVLYEPGKEVPIGKEPKVELQVEDKTAAELSKELKEKYGIKMAAQKGKDKLLEALREAEAKAAEEAKKLEDEESEEEETEPTEEDGEEDSNEDEGESNPSEDEDAGTPDEETDLLNQIINE